MDHLISELLLINYYIPSIRHIIAANKIKNFLRNHCKSFKLIDGKYCYEIIKYHSPYMTTIIINDIRMLYIGYPSDSDAKL
jgi:hypothetical protein